MDTQNNNTTEYRYSIPKSGYGLYKLVLDLFLRHSDELVQELEKSHETRGRHGYPARDQLRVFLLQFLLNERYNSHLLNELSASPKLLGACGINEVPSEYAYCRFKKKLAAYLHLLAEIYDLTLRDINREIKRLKKAGIIPKKTPRLGEYLAIDATDIKAWAKYRPQHCDTPGRESCTRKHKRHCNDPDREKCTVHSNKPIADPSAMVGYRTPKGMSGASAADDGEDGEDKKKTDRFLGYKAHVVSDAVYGIPLHMVLRPANEPETTHFAEDLRATQERHPWLKPKFMLADKGYDSLPNFKHTAGQGIIPIIAVRRPVKEKKTGRRLFDGTYTKDGRPLCLGGKPMSWLGRDPDGAHHFRCPPGGCPLKNKVDWSRYCNSEHSEKPEGRLLRIMGIVPRFSKAWRKIYKKRTEIERWFSSAKRSRLFDSHQLLRVGKINLHVNMSMLAWLLTALARLKADDYRRMRHMYIRLPRAGPAPVPAEVQECAECCLCPQHGRLA